MNQEEPFSFYFGSYISSFFPPTLFFLRLPFRSSSVPPQFHFSFLVFLFYFSTLLSILGNSIPLRIRLCQQFYYDPQKVCTLNKCGVSFLTRCMCDHTRCLYYDPQKVCTLNKSGVSFLKCLCERLPSFVLSSHSTLPLVLHRLAHGSSSIDHLICSSRLCYSVTSLAHCFAMPRSLFALAISRVSSSYAVPYFATALSGLPPSLIKLI